MAAVIIVKSEYSENLEFISCNKFYEDTFCKPEFHNYGNSDSVWTHDQPLRTNPMSTKGSL